MKTRFFLLSLLLTAFSSRWTPAQTSAPVTAPAAEAPSTATAAASAPDPVKIADFEKRFAQGNQLQADGKLAEARTIYEGILAEAPDAKGSLLKAGLISFQLNDLIKADEYLSRFHTLVPDYPAAIEALIQINQALKRDVKVIRLLQEFHQLHAGGANPKFSQSLVFDRERIHLDGINIVISEFFNYHDEPYIVWIAKASDAAGRHPRQVLLTYDPDLTKEIRAKDPKFAHNEEFLLVEDVTQDGQLKRIDVYKQLFALPDYTKTRNTMLAILGNALKPIQSQEVNAPAPTK